RLPAPSRAALAVGALVLASCSTPKLPHEVIVNQQNAWNRGDLEAFLAEGYLESPDLTFFGASDPVVGYQAVLERYRRSYQEGGAEMGELEFGQLEISYLGNKHALARGHWHLTFSDDSTAEGWFSLVFVETHRGWRILHDHTSSLENEG
ncbi:MAG: nuclear transport factor 2 family protein, partial [Planctomycetes bacterium]|nr:nuclear transport factor 2 family protein [Planctomycetota bacterium]